MLVCSRLKVFCCWWLANAASIVEESVGTRRMYSISTSNGISKESFGSNDKPTWEIGQRNILLWTFCRYKSILIFKRIEKEDELKTAYKELALIKL